MAKIPSFIGTLNVSEDNQVACPQSSMFGLASTEDCLYLHVLTPNISGNFPVLFWIHGGGHVFRFGGPYPLDGMAKNLASRGVVVVAANYRLNLFGFFTKRNAEFPGNMALLDHVQALRWVQAEIRNFGGNPAQVTIFGESAGGNSVSLLTYSPLAKGLFKQAIMQSGTVFGYPWAWNGLPKDTYVDCSQQLAIALNCTTAEQWNSGKNLQEVIKCLQQKPADQLTSSDQCGVWGAVFGPYTSLMPKSLPELQAERQPLNALIGNTKDEGSPITPDSANETLPMSMFNEAYFNARLDNQFANVSYGEYAETFKLLARNRYAQQTFLKADDYLGWLDVVTKMAGDNAVIATLKEAQSLLNSNSTVFLYSFDHLSSEIKLDPPVRYVPHADDVQYEFGHFKIFKPNADDLKVVDIMGKAFTNFAKTGNPNTPDPLAAAWNPISHENPVQYFQILPNPRMMDSFHWDTYQFYVGLLDSIQKYINPSVNCQTRAARTATTAAPLAANGVAATSVIVIISLIIHLLYSY